MQNPEFRSISQMQNTDFRSISQIKNTETSKTKIYTSGRSRISHWGGTNPLGGANLQCIHFLAKTYVKMKKMDPVGGVRTSSTPLDLPMYTSDCTKYFIYISIPVRISRSVSWIWILDLISGFWICATINTPSAQDMEKHEAPEITEQGHIAKSRFCGKNNQIYRNECEEESSRS